MELEQKQAEYSKYIKEHILNVRRIWDYFSYNFCKGKFWLDDFNYFQINMLIDIHDKSKYSCSEFEIYREKFFPIKDSKNIYNFEQAWNHHQKTNPHHWEYWVMYKKTGSIALEMEFKYIIEMLCDWAAMSYKFKNSITKWYNTNKKDMLLNEKTVNTIELYLPLFEKVLQGIENE